MDMVTSIERHHGKMRMTVNEEKTFLIPISLFKERPFNLGDTLDSEEYDNWLMVRQFKHAMDKAGGYLSARSRSSKELERLLLRAGYLESTVEMIIYKLKKMHYLDDEAFAAQWVEARSGKAIGKRRLEQELYQKGISKDAAQEALTQIDSEVLQGKADALAQKLAKKYASEEPRKAVQKLMQALVRRGFDWDEARSAAQGALKEENGD